jgi:hypothetical protein
LEVHCIEDFYSASPKITHLGDCARDTTLSFAHFINSLCTKLCIS